MVGKRLLMNSQKVLVFLTMIIIAACNQTGGSVEIQTDPSNDLTSASLISEGSDISGSVELNNGACCTGGTIGDEVIVSAKISLDNRQQETTLMRTALSTSCLSADGLTDAEWIPFQSQQVSSYVAISGWIGIYFNVQFMNETGEISQIFCDDISVEGLPVQNSNSSENVAMLTFENNLDVMICYIQVVVNPISQEVNLATIGDPLLAGEIREIPINIGNTVDVEITDCDDQLVERVEDMLITEEGVHYFLSPTTGLGAE
jgi:hypothetical protein